VIRGTGQPTDLALQGEGFFVLAGEDGEMLTRNGSFSLDNEGYLIGAGARRVLGTAGPIRASGGQLAVTPSGAVFVQGSQVAQLRLETAEVGLTPALPGAVYPRPITAELAGQDVRVQQGALEFSGGDLAGEITTMLTALRSYEAAQRVTRTHDELTQRLLEKLGNL
jgi:flagellar basal body rod protein FlgG